MNSAENKTKKPDFYTIFWSGGVKAYGARLERLDDRNTLVRTGSASWVFNPERETKKLLEVGDNFVHWQLGRVTVRKINRKTLIVHRHETGTIQSLPLG